MYVFGHLGFGYVSVRPWWKRVPLAPLLWGSVLPDLIDKPLYYVPAFLTGRRGTDLGLICGTRTFGHTAVFLLLCLALAAWRRSRAWAALCAGIASHLLLDNFGDLFLASGDTRHLRSLLWPWPDGQFPPMVYANMEKQLARGFSPLPLSFEIFGLIVMLYLLARKLKRPDRVTP